MTEPTRAHRAALIRRPAVIGGALVAVGLLLVGVAVVGGHDSSGNATGSTSTSVSAPATDGGTSTPGFDRTAGSTAPGRLGSGWATERRGRTPLSGFGEVAATITSGSGKVCKLCLLAATTAAQRERGLMAITDRKLGGYDGMVFAYPAPVSGAFWMRNTPTPLSIAYFDASGALVSTVDMAPCADEPTCPSYPPDGPFAYAVEVVQGRLPDVGVTGAATIRIDAATCPLAAGGS